jgi:hypothetical protein
MERRDRDPNEPRRVEPWPWILACMLAFMIGTSISFWVIARTHPDPVIERSPHPGVER